MLLDTVEFGGIVISWSISCETFSATNAGQTGVLFCEKNLKFLFHFPMKVQPRNLSK